MAQPYELNYQPENTNKITITSFSFSGVFAARCACQGVRQTAKQVRSSNGERIPMSRGHEASGVDTRAIVGREWRESFLGSLVNVSFKLASTWRFARSSFSLFSMSVAPFNSPVR